MQEVTVSGSEELANLESSPRKRPTVDELLDTLRNLELQKADSIAALLAERTQLLASTKLRLEEISAALKLLGHKKKRGPRKSKSADAGASVGLPTNPLASAKRKRS